MFWISFSVKFPVLLPLLPMSKLGHNWLTFMLKQLINPWDFKSPNGDLQLLFFRAVGTVVLMVSQNIGIIPFPIHWWISRDFLSCLQHLHNSMEWISSGRKVFNGWKDRAEIFGAREHFHSSDWVQGELGKSKQTGWRGWWVSPSLT